MGSLTDGAERKFAGHETFHPRYGWFRKAVVAAQASTYGRDSLLAEDATVRLGVGKNMVTAIRFWGRAAKLVDTPKGQGKTPRTFPTLNGIAIFDEKKGLDPYLELAGTLWVLHWWMLQPKTELPVWWLTFFRFPAVEFTEDELVAFIMKEIEDEGWKKPNESSVRKDVTCLLRMYFSSIDARGALDDRLDCPMRELALIEQAWGQRTHYRFLLGPKPTLPDLVLLYACLDFMSRQSSTGSTMSVKRLATDIGAPGRAFRIGEEQLTVVLERATKKFGFVELTSTSGVRTLACSKDVKLLCERALRDFYKSTSQRAASKLQLGAQAITPHAPELKLKPKRKNEG